MTLSIDLGLPDLVDTEEIGRGGFGVVYRAQQKSVGRKVAVKMLATVSLSDETRRRFERECKAMAAVSSHPNIIALYDSGMTATGRPYIVMEYAPGGALASRLPQSWERAVEVAIKMAGALETAHQIGIFHRDVKPENILLSAYGEPKLTDFGVAKVAESSETPSGNITASILHAAPETLSGTRPSAATDVYSLASTIYALIAGRAPFAADHEEETLAPLLTRISTAPVPDLRPRGVPGRICEVLERAMSKSPGERPLTPAVFGRLLNEAQTAVGVAPTEMLIEGVDREPSGSFKALADEGATQPRDLAALGLPVVDVPSQATNQVSNPPLRFASSTDEPRRRNRRTMAIVGSVVALLVAGGGGAVLLNGGGGSSSGTHAVDHSAAYAFSDAA